MGNALKAGHTPSKEVPEGYKRTEVGVIPEDWDICTLPDVIDKFVNGGTPSTSNTDFWSGDIPWITGADILNQTVAIIRRYITEEAVHNSSTNVIAKGNLLIVSRTGVGKLAIAPCDIAISQDFTGLIHNKEKILAQYLFRHFDFCQQVLIKQNQGTSIKGITRDTLAAIFILLPPLKEQCAIAEALSDVDGLLSVLEELIAKKRAIKQATMQQLLTGKTRLPGFSGEWAEKPLIKLATITMGQSPPSMFYNLRGEGLPLIQGNADIEDRQTIDRVWTTHGSKRCDAGDLLLTVRAPVGAVAVAKKKACLGRGVCGLKPIGDSAFLFHALVQSERSWQILEQGSTFTSANSEQIGQFRLRIPTGENEQQAIAAILSDMDAEIAALEQQRGKAHAIKQGMMQQLLTGRIRLAQPETTKEELAVERPVGRKHNWQFNEAVVISVLAKHFGNEQYPLGRMRYTKLLYLLHRREEGQVEGYLKKAAGPYNPQTRYGGPEKIALQKDYMRRHRSDRGQGFIASANVEEAEHYFDRWYGGEVLQWLEQFRYKKNNDLELLTTVDMAVEELCEAGEEVSVESVKDVIRSNPEWKPKLDRSIFSDANLARAIEDCQKLFDY